MIPMHKTVISRKSLSAPAKAAFSPTWIGQSVLDFGCGRGDDVKRLRDLGVCAQGYDPYTPFGYSCLPEGLFNVVTLLFVLNVLPDPVQRIAVLRAAWEKVISGGCLLVAVRPYSDVCRAEGRSKTPWVPHSDGWLTTRGTFQRGYRWFELVSLCRDVLGVRDSDKLQTWKRSSFVMTCIWRDDECL